MRFCVLGVLFWKAIIDNLKERFSKMLTILRKGSLSKLGLKHRFCVFKYVKQTFLLFLKRFPNHKNLSSIFLKIKIWVLKLDRFKVSTWRSIFLSGWSNNMTRLT